MVDHPRARKMADRIRVLVAELLEHRVKDPRLGFITITDSRVSGDLQHATLFYTVYGSDDEKTSTAAALESAKGMLRREVGAQLGVRVTPTLEFTQDAVPENAAAIEDLLRQAREHDEQVAAMASTAQYAGGQDPYRTKDDQQERVDDSEFDDSAT